MRHSKDDQYELVDNPERVVSVETASEYGDDDGDRSLSPPSDEGASANVEEKDVEEDSTTTTKRNKHIGGAALIGGATGLIIGGGPTGAMVGAGTAALLAKNCEGRAGDALRSSGAAVERKVPENVRKGSSRAIKTTSERVLAASVSLREFDNEHTKVSEKIRNVDKKHGIAKKVQNTSTRALEVASNGISSASAKLRELDEKHNVSERLRDVDKKHRVTERSSKVMASVSNSCKKAKDNFFLKSFSKKQKEAPKVELTAS